MSTVSPSVSSAKSAFGGSDHTLREDLEALRADLGTLKSDLRTLVGDSAHAGKHAAQAARERLGAAAERAGERAKEAFDAAKAKGREAGEALEETIEEHPFTSVGVAFAAGLLIGALISRK